MEKMSLKEPKCDYCRYFVEAGTKYSCKAFPEGIPAEAMWAEWDSECVPGIKFEESAESGNV